MKELDQSEYNVEIVKDLGVLNVTATEKRRCAIFRCECGKEFQSQVRYVKSGKKPGCPTCNMSNAQTTHGLTKHPIYKAHNDMRRRCYSPKSERYSSYGARGITIYKEWKDSFEIFYVWALAHGWKKGLTIDRKDPEGSYEPSNCRWIDKRSQAQNKRKLGRNTSGYIGVKLREGRFYAQAQSWDKKRVHLGTYDTSIEAAKARDSYYVIHGFTEMTLNNVDLFNDINHKRK